MVRRCDVLWCDDGGGVFQAVLPPALGSDFNRTLCSCVGERLFESQATNMSCTIFVKSYAGTSVKLDDVEYLILKESDILGVIEG